MSFDGTHTKQLPAAVEVERMVLGALLLEDEQFENVSVLLKPAHFYDSKNADVYAAMLELNQSSLKIEHVSLYEILKKRDKLASIGGAGYIGQLAQETSTAANIEYHARVVYEKYLLREMINLSNSIASECYNYKGDDVFSTLEKAKNKFEHLDDEIEFVQGDKELFASLPEIFEAITDEQKEDTARMFKSDLFQSFNDATGGVKAGEMVVISGKDKAGKTTFGLSLLIDFARKYKEPTAAFTLEMPFDQYSRKILSLATGTRYSYLRAPGERNRDGSLIYDEKKILDTKAGATRAFSNNQFFIIDEVMNDDQMRSKIRYINRKYGVGLIMVDYISLVEAAQKYERPDLRIAAISRMLKLITNELKLRTIVISQENDEGSTADSKALRKDCDFWFSISHPVDDEITEVKLGNERLKPDAGLHIVNFKRTRHSASGGRFACYYMKDGSFREIDPRYYKENVGEDYNKKFEEM